MKQKLKKLLQFISGLLAILKWVPLPGDWRKALVAIAALTTGLTALVEKCDSNPGPVVQPEPQKQATLAPPSPTPTPTHTPTPSPKPPDLIVPERIIQREAFVVKVNRPFEYNTALKVEKYHLCYLGKEYKTGHMVCTVTLWTAGRRTLRVTLSTGETLEKTIYVEGAGSRAQ